MIFHVTPAFSNNALIICISTPVLPLITWICSMQVLKGSPKSLALRSIANPSLTLLIPDLSLLIILVRKFSTASSCLSSKKLIVFILIGLTSSLTDKDLFSFFVSSLISKNNYLIRLQRYDNFSK